MCPQKDLAEYESNFRYSSRTIPAVRCLKPYCGDRTKQAKDTIMKRTMIRNMFAVTLARAPAVDLARTAQAADKGCSSATLTGTFAYTNTGTGFFTAAAPPLQAGPFAGAGVETFDGNGGATATTWVSINGNIFLATRTGTYPVNPDCTGTLTLVPPSESFRDRCQPLSLKSTARSRTIKVSHDRGLPDSIILSPPGIGVGTKPHS